MSGVAGLSSLSQDSRGPAEEAQQGEEEAVGGGTVTQPLLAQVDLLLPRLGAGQSVHGSTAFVDLCKYDQPHVTCDMSVSSLTSSVQVNRLEALVDVVRADDVGAVMLRPGALERVLCQARCAGQTVQTEHLTCEVELVSRNNTVNLPLIIRSVNISLISMLTCTAKLHART